MIRLPDATLPSATAAALDALQKEVDKQPDYPSRVKAAKKNFSAHNKEADVPIPAAADRHGARSGAGAVYD